MKPFVRHILTLCAALLLAALYIFVLTAERVRQRGLSCQGLKVHITDSARLSFVSEGDIKKYMEDYGPFIGKLVDDVDLQQIETIMLDKSAILGCEAYMDRSGYLNIEIGQREPAIRFQKGEQGFYADEKGFIFPLQTSYTSRVPIIDGAVPIKAGNGFKGKPDTEKEQLWLNRIIALVAYMQTNGWSKRISQITVQPDGNLVLVPAEGKEKFIFGAPDRFEAKFDRIRTYYEAVVPSLEKISYGVVDVRFDKQIICKK